jgi:hypothetical protein
MTHVVPTNTTTVGSRVISCLGWGFLGSFLSIMVWFLTKPQEMQKLSEMDQYRKVAEQRLWITATGFLLGIVPSIYLTMTCRFRIGHFLFYLFFIVYSVYTAWPKRSLLDSNNTINMIQAKEWIKVHRAIHGVSALGFCTAFVISAIVIFYTEPKPTSPCQILQ